MKRSEETKKKISETCKRNRVGTWMKGRSLSSDTRTKMSRNHAKYWTGKKRSQETIDKISQAKSGANHQNYGKHLPPSTKMKIGKANSNPSAEARVKLSQCAARSIKRGAFKSLNSKWHNLFIQLFKAKFGIELEKEFQLATDDGHIKSYDCRMPGRNILFEIDGRYWHSLPKAIIADKLKDELAAQLGFILYRIPADKVIEFVTAFSLEPILREVPKSND